MKKFLIFSLLISPSFLNSAFATTLKLYPKKDTCILEWEPRKNYGSSNYLYLANLERKINSKTPGSLAYVLMDFDRSRIDFSKVKHISLHVNHGGTFGRLLSPSDVTIWKFDKPWSENSTYVSLSPLSFRWTAIATLKQEGTTNQAMADLPSRAVKNLSNGLILGVTKKAMQEVFIYSREHEFHAFLLVEY